jgi:hypothetical protein
VPIRFGAKVTFIVIAFSSALLSEAAAWMTRFWHPEFAILKVAMFVLFQSCLAFLILGLGAFIGSAERQRRKRRAERHHHVHAGG